MSSSFVRAVRSQVDARPHLRVRLYKAAYVLLTLFSLTACATAVQQQEACFWPQSAMGGCHELAERTPRG